MSRKSNLFALLICLVFAFVCLVSCAEVTLSPEVAAKQQAETDAQEVLGKIVWDSEDREAITSNLSFPSENLNYPGVHIEWQTTEEDVIGKDGKVTLLYDNDPRAYKLKPEDTSDDTHVISVTVTATVYADYSWEDETGTHTEKTEPISKQFEFTVFAMPEDTDQGTIKEVKDRAWNFFYVENNAPKNLTTYQAQYYSVFVSGIVVGKLNGDTKGFFLYDGTDTIYVYGSNSSYQIGSKVQVFGQVYIYYGNLQIGSKVSASFTTGFDVALPEYENITPTEWESQTKGLTDDVIGRFGGRALEVEGVLEAGTSAAKDEYKIVDPATGEVAWIYYKSYNKQVEGNRALEEHLGKYVKLTGISYARDSRTNKNQLLWTGGIEEAQAPVVDDETKVNVALSQITLKDSYTEDFDLSAAGAWEVVSGTGIVIENGVAKVTRGDADQTVVLKVTVTSGEYSASKEFTVTVKAIVKETPKHAGTKEDPYTVSDAVLAAGALEADVLSEQVYAVGTIVSIKEVSAQYGNATFNISDGKQEIIVYRAKYLNNEKFTSEDQIKVGDNVLICGQLVNYKGNTLEFNSGCYIDSFVEELPQEGDGSKENPFTVEQVIAEASKLEVGATTEVEYYTIGTIVSIKEVSAQYGNATFNISDGTNEFICYRAKYLNSEKFTSEDQIKVGDVVVICGKLTNYNGTLEYQSNCYIVEFVGSAPEQPEHEHKFENGQCACGEKDPNYVEPEVPGDEVEGAVELTVDSLGIASQTYAAGTATVNGVAFEFIQIGNYGNGLQMRDKDGKTSLLWNTSAFGAGIVKIELVYSANQEVKYANPDCVIFSFGNAVDSYTYSTKLSTSAGVKTYTITPDTTSYTFFKLEHDLGYTLYWDSIKIYFAGEAGSAPEQPEHEHKFENGQCACGEKDPNYVAPENEKISIEQAITLGSAQAHNTYTAEKYIIEGTITEVYNTQYGNMYITDGVNTITVYGLYSADGKVRYDAMAVKPVAGDKVVVMGVVGQYNNSAQLKNAWLVEHEAGEHEHKYENGKCACGAEDPNYVAPELPGNVVEFDFSTGTTSMASDYNAAAAEMTVNGITFGYLQMKASGYSGSNFLMFKGSTDAHLYNKTAFSAAIVKIEVFIPSGASAKAGYYLSLHKEATEGNVTSDVHFVGNGASFEITADAAEGFTYFNLSSDSTTTKNGQLLKIVVTLADGTTVAVE